MRHAYAYRILVASVFRSTRRKYPLPPTLPRPPAMRIWARQFQRTARRQQPEADRVQCGRDLASLVSHWNGVAADHTTAPEASASSRTADRDTPSVGSCRAWTASAAQTARASAMTEIPGSWIIGDQPRRLSRLGCSGTGAATEVSARITVPSIPAHLRHHGVAGNRVARIDQRSRNLTRHGTTVSADRARW